VQDLGDAFPGIEKTPGVCGGEPCIVRTRIPVWVLEKARRLGASNAEILRSYPTLRVSDLVNTWAYVRSHKDEIDRQKRENEEAYAWRIFTRNDVCCRYVSFLFSLIEIKICQKNKNCHTRCYS